MLKKLSVLSSAFLFSVSAPAAVFNCSLMKVPPIGVDVSPEQIMKSFEIDTSNVPAHKSVTFKDLKMSVHSDGKHIQVRVSNPKQEIVASISSYETEVSAQIGEDASGYCVSEDVTADAVGVDSLPAEELNR